MKKIICMLCACFLLLGCSCVKSTSDETCLKPIEEFFEALNQGSYEKYEACHVPQLKQIEGKFAYEKRYIDCRRDMLGEKAIYKILEKRRFYEEEKVQLRKYCEKYGIENESFSLILFDSNLASLPLNCYLVQNDGVWKILSWEPLYAKTDK